MNSSMIAKTEGPRLSKEGSTLKKLLYFSRSLRTLAAAAYANFTKGKNWPRMRREIHGKTMQTFVANTHILK